MFFSSPSSYPCDLHQHVLGSVVCLTKTPGICSDAQNKSNKSCCSLWASRWLYLGYGFHSNIMLKDLLRPNQRPVLPFHIRIHIFLLRNSWSIWWRQQINIQGVFWKSWKAYESVNTFPLSALQEQMDWRIQDISNLWMTGTLLHLNKTTHSMKDMVWALFPGLHFWILPWSV